MLFLKHGDYEIDNKTKLEGLLAHAKETLSQVKGITYKNIYFVSGALAFAIVPQNSSYVDSVRGNGCKLSVKKEHDLWRSQRSHLTKYTRHILIE